MICDGSNKHVVDRPLDLSKVRLVLKEKIGSLLSCHRVVGYIGLQAKVG